MKRTDWWESARSPLSTNTEGGGDGFGRGLRPNNHLLFTRRKREEEKERESSNTHNVNDPVPARQRRCVLGLLVASPGHDSAESALGSGNFDSSTLFSASSQKHFEGVSGEGTYLKLN